MSSRVKKPTVTVSNLFKNHSDRILRLMLADTKRGWTGPEIATKLGISKAWAARTLATLEFEKYAYRDGKKPHGRTFLLDPEKLIQRWKLSYNIDFNEQHPYRVVGRDPLKLIAIAAKRESFRFAITGKAAKAIQKKKPIVNIPCVYVWSKSQIETDFYQVLETLVDSYDFIPTEKKPNIIILKPYSKDGIWEGIKSIDELKLVSELQCELDLTS